jgi:O-antigen/teichoic acid export membrane protein
MAYVFIKGGDWLIGRLLDVKTLALYQMAFLISTTAATEIGMMVYQLCYPLFSRLQDDRARLQAALGHTFGLVSIVTFAMAGLLIACSPDFFRLVLGEKWLAALPFIVPFTIWGVCSIFGNVFSGLFQALGRPRLWTQTVFFMAALLAAGIFPMTHRLGALGVAILMAFIGALMQFTSSGILGRLLGIPFTKVLSHAAIPTAASIVSVVVATQIRPLLPSASSLYGLMVSALVFTSMYLLCLGLGNRWMEPSPQELAQRLIASVKSPRLVPLNPVERPAA